MNLSDRLLFKTPQRWLTPRMIAQELDVWRRLEGRHAGKRIFIIGAGPSVNRMDLSRLAGELTIVANEGFRHARAIRLKPTYLAIIDDLYATPDFRPILREAAAFCHATGAEVLCERMIALAFRSEPEPPICHGTYLIMRSRLFEEAGQPLPLDFTVAHPDFESVMHFAIAACLFMGASEIVLVGCDMSYFVEPKKIHPHSYRDGSNLSSGKDVEEYYGMDQVDLLGLAAAEFRSFRMLRDMAETRGARVVNATEGGYLEVFERVSLASLTGTAAKT